MSTVLSLIISHCDQQSVTSNFQRTSTRKITKIVLTVQRGVTNTAHHSIDIICRGVMLLVTLALSLIRLYLDNIRRKFNRAHSCLFMKELALLWCGRQLLEIISSLFLSSQSLGFLFAVINFIDGFMRHSHSEIKQEANVIASLT
jgi:hypothetical protein